LSESGPVSVPSCRMCFAQTKQEPSQAPIILHQEKGRRKRWKSFANSLVPNKLIKALKEVHLEKVLDKNRERIKSATHSARIRVHRVTHWVFQLSFARIVIPILFLGFLKILGPHPEIQLGVLTASIVCSCGFLLVTREKTHKSTKRPKNEEVSILQDNNSGYEYIQNDIDLRLEADVRLKSLNPPLFWKLYLFFPLNFLSRVWGYVASMKLPPPLDVFSVRLYASAFSCKRDEAELEISEYKTISEFFTRRLKPGLRPIDVYSELVSPADGLVTFQGKVKGKNLQQVKGVSYCLHTFLGDDQCRDHGYLLQNSPESHDLHQVVVYLGPADYHRFHSPATWMITSSTHIPGSLLSVRPDVVGALPGLFHTNERAVFRGSWKHGFFSLIAVGATNVGSIVVHADRELATNTGTQSISRRIYPAPLEALKGEEFGHFNFGSTIVLLFEAPREMELHNAWAAPHRIRVGEALCDVREMLK